MAWLRELSAFIPATGKGEGERGYREGGGYREGKGYMGGKRV